MYLSKNSRYVLQKAQWFTPSSCLFTCLKGNEKSLSIKYPKEDPTKPPLRRNIPTDSPVDHYSNVIPEPQRRDLSEHRSKNLISKTGNSSPPLFEDGLLPRSESEIQLPKFTPEQYFMTENPEKESHASRTDSSYEASFLPSDEVIGEIFVGGESESNDIPKRPNVSHEKEKKQTGNKLDASKKEAKQKEASGGGRNSDLGSSDHRIVHIIIDFPQKIDENLNLEFLKSKENAARKFPNNLVRHVSIRESKEHVAQKPSINQPKKWRSRSMNFNAKPNKKRFEVHEIQDSGTYVLHLKFKNAAGVETVPEKEVKTRNATIPDFSMRTNPASKIPQKPVREVTAVEDVPEVIKYREKKKKKSKFSKREVKPKSTSLPQIDPELNENVQASEFLDWQQPQYYELPVSDSFEEKKSLLYVKKNENVAYEKKNILSTLMPVLQTAKAKEAEPEENPTENMIVGDEVRIKVEPTIELREAEKEVEKRAEVAAEKKVEDADEKEELLAEPVLEEQVEETERVELESSPQVENENFAVSSYRDPHESTEKPKLASEGDRPPPTDWMVPSFMGSHAERSKEAETTDKFRPKKKFKNSVSVNKKGKGKSKKKTFGPGSKNARPKRFNFEVTDFKSGASSVPIKCDKPTYAMKLSAAYPPLLNEAMKRRYYRYRSNSVYNFKPGMNMQSKDLEMSPKAVEVIPIKISKSNESSDFIGCQSDGSLQKTTNVPKIGDNICNIANENITQSKGMASLDSLAMMKKVKEIVDLDLNNAIKIFKPDSGEVISSVVISKGMGEWALDEMELRKCLAIQKSEFLNDIKKAESTRDFFGDVELNLPKYLPTTKEGQMEMKLDHSVVILNPDTNKFTVDVEDLQEAVKRRTEESFDDVVVEKLEGLLTGTKSEPILVFSAVENAKMISKSGDSILVFDENTQKWKVDYSILEKREQQLRDEEELTKRSEFILETIEKLEKENIPTVPKPETRDRKTFDYNKEQWKDYGPEKRSKSTKSPFKESDAKEIRKKNSDLYEDLFVKKDKIKKSDGLQSTEIKLCKKTSATESGTTKETPVTPSKPETIPTTPEPITQKKDSPVDQKVEDDNYWETFLNITNPLGEKKIQDITETKKPKIRAPGPPPPPPPTPPPTPPVSSPPGPKIEEPKFKIKIPVLDGNKKKKTIKDIPLKKPHPKEKKPKPPVSPGVTEKPKLKLPIPPSKSEKQKESKVTVPPTTKPPATKKEEPKAKPPTPPASPLPPPPPKKETPKTKPPPATKKEDPKEKIKPIKKKEKEVPGSASLIKKTPTSKTEPKVKAPSPASIKPKEDPKSGGKKDKAAADHYISKNIVELSRNSKDKNSKIKTNKIETVKLNITADRRLPSKVMEINLNKKFDKPKESSEASKNEKKNERGVDNRIFYKKFEKYKSPFSDLEYEEKSMKIKSDIASNPNLKKLGNWNKTLVLHDIAKPPENIESWLKDETDKMATLLLKVLQEATDGKPRRKSSRPKLTDKGHHKANPYDNIRKKQETTTHDSFLFKVRPMKGSSENNKKKANQGKTNREIDNIRNLPIQPAKPEKILEVKAPAAKKENLMKTSSQFVSIVPEGKPSTSGLEAIDPLISRDFLQQCRLASEITDDVPGPELMKRMANTWKVFPIFSIQITIFTLIRLFQLVNLGKSFLDNNNPEKSRRYAFSKLFSRYGPIVNVQGPLSGSVILIYKPEHLSAVFEQDASIPVRSVFDSLEQSRREAEDKHLPVGMCTEWNTPQWAELKKHTNDPLIKGRDKFFTTVEAAGDSLIGNIRKNKNQQNFASEDFMDEIKRWSLEGLCSVLFEKSFGFLEGKSKSMSWILEPDKLYMSIDEATSYLSKCERGFQTWRLMTTPSAAGLKQSYRTLSGIVAKQIFQAEANLKNKNEMLKNNKMHLTKDLTFLESMLLNDGMTPDEITCNLIDIMLIGTNAMSSALGFLLYDLTQNVKVQNRLLNEVREILPNKSSRLEYHKFYSLRYLQACLKESLRLHMPVPIFFRMLQNDILLSNYIIPKGTYVVMDYRVSCMREQIFDEPEKFHPERWLEDEKWIQNFHPFATLPLCHGPRAELAKRVIEMQILACVAKIIRNFQIEYQFGEIQATENIIAFPDKPLKFNFIERDF